MYGDYGANLSCFIFLKFFFFFCVWMTCSKKHVLFMINSHTFDPALEKAVLFAVGNTLVCDDLNEAKHLSWSGERFKGER